MAKSKLYLESSSETCRKAWGVARTSTKTQCDSLEVQEAEIKEYCNRHPELDYQELHKLQESAYSCSPGLLDKITDALEPKCALIFHKIDRFSRNTADYGVYLETIAEKDIEIHFISEGIVWNKNTDRDTLNRISSLINDAEKESIRSSKRVKSTNTVRRSHGQTTYAAPVGYQNYTEGTEKGWRIHPIYGAIVKELFELYATGKYSLNDIVKIAFDKGVYGKIKANAGIIKPMCKQTVVNMLTNRFYIGEAKYENEGNVQYYNHIYPKLISEELFNKCQEIYTGKKHRSKTDSKQLKSAFTGLIKDENSGKLFTPYCQKGNIYLKSPVSGQKDLKEKIFLNSFLSVLKELSETPQIADILNNRANLENKSDTSLLNNELDSLKKELDTKQAQVETLLINPPASAKQEQIDKAIAKMNDEIAKIEEKIPVLQEQIQKHMGKQVKLTQDLTSSFQDLNCQAQNNVLKILFSCINFQNNRITFVINEDFREILKKHTYIRQYVK